MLFLYRPRQTWIPYRRPRKATQQDAYNRRLQQAFDETRRAAPPAPAPVEPAHDVFRALRDLAALHDSGVLTDTEFTAAKAKLLGVGADNDAT